MLRLRTLPLVLIALAFTTMSFAKTAKSNTSVTAPSAFAISERLSNIPIDLSSFPAREMPEPRPSALASRAVPGPWQLDPVLQKQVLPPVSATMGMDFDGIGANGWSPSDNNMDVGPNHIVEIVNVQIAIYNKSGANLSGPTNIMNLFTKLGGKCAALIVDPIVLYDRPADRWLVGGIGDNGGYSECIAVSTTNDPTGTYALYSYDFGSILNDYDKLSVWATASNSAYLATYNLNGARADLCAFDRTKMLAGDPSAKQLCQQAPPNESSYLPSDMDGPDVPVDGTPAMFLTWQNNNPGQLFLRKLTLDFASGTATLSKATTISVANDTLACGSCVPQVGTSEGLDTLGDRLMYRFAIRHFADHDRAVVNHAVTNGSQVAVRWYELYDPAGAVTLNQQGTYAPDATYRWMGSIAEDKNADIGLGYSASSSSIHPAIRFTGRVPSDALGTMETEASILEGTGSQTSGLSRWGDYTAMRVDPSDDCTFWYVDSYEKSDGTGNWSTHIASFAFNGCGGGGGGAAVTLTPTSLKWGKILVGVKSAAKKVIVQNTGNATLNITNIAVSGDFALATVKQTKRITPCVNGSALTAGATCEVKVTFTPTQTGTRTGSVTFSDNASDSPQSVTLTGKGK